MQYRNPATGRTVEIGANEGVRRRILERSGWRRVGTPAGLAEDLPGRDVLAAHGYTSAEMVRAARDDDLLALPGIGPATLAKLREALG